MRIANNVFQVPTNYKYVLASEITVRLYKNILIMFSRGYAEQCNV